MGAAWGRATSVDRALRMSAVLHVCLPGPLPGPSVCAWESVCAACLPSHYYETFGFVCWNELRSERKLEDGQGRAVRVCVTSCCP